MKECSSCGATRTISEFWRNDSVCKICREDTRLRKEMTDWGTFELKARLLGLIYKPIWFPDASPTLHLDHVFSLYRGFQLFVPLPVLCNRGNLCLLDSASNKRKGQSCWITLEQLHQRQEMMDGTFHKLVELILPQNHATIKRWIRAICAERRQETRNQFLKDFV